jgi:hypothetical protein
MPWDYVNVIAPVIAIINSVIAASISHFRPEKYHLKVVILAASIVLGLIAAAATVYGQYSSVQERRAEIARQNEIRNHLGSLISREDGLLALLRDPSQPFPATSGNAWASEAETYLKESLGADMLTGSAIVPECFMDHRLALTPSVLATGTGFTSESPAFSNLAARFRTSVVAAAA